MSPILIFNCVRGRVFKSSNQQFYNRYLETKPMSEFNQKIIEEFRANDGIVGEFFEGKTVLLLHTIGAKSGKKRLNPLVTMADADRYIIIASAGGAEKHPAWYHNIKANTNVRVEVGTEQFDAEATITEEPERSELYAKMTVPYPFFADYAEKTAGIRTIPVITLSRS